MAHELFLAEDFYGKTNSIYEAIIAIARRARQIGEEQRKEMDAYLSQVEMLEKFQEDEESYDEPVRPHEPVLQFEKPTVLSLREMISEKLEIIRPEEEAVAGEEETAGGITGGEGGFPMKLDISGEEEGSKKESFPSKIDLSGEEE